MIQLEKLSMKFGRSSVLNGIDLTILPGESVALWGSNGAGKTTILKCIIGLLRFKGKITVGGYDVARQGKQSRQLIGYVPQELVFNDDLRVKEAIELFSKLKGVRGTNVDETLKRVNLNGHERKRMRELSGGMKQRLALAIALIGDPKVLLLDEVTASLDAMGRDEFIAVLSNVARRSEQCMLFASHRVEEIKALATRVLTIDAGKVVEDTFAEAFHERFRDRSGLHLTMDINDRLQAINVLNQSGYSARMNGHGIILHVPTSDRMSAIQLLGRHQIEVKNFDFLENANHGSNL